MGNEECSRTANFEPAGLPRSLPEATDQGFAGRGPFLAHVGGRLRSRAARRTSSAEPERCRPLLADAEAAENAIENVVGVDGPHDAPHFRQGQPNFSHDQLFAGARAIEFRGLR